MAFVKRAKTCFLAKARRDNTPNASVTVSISGAIGARLSLAIARKRALPAFTAGNVLAIVSSVASSRPSALELVQKLLECFFSCPTGRRHRVKKSGACSIELLSLALRASPLFDAPQAVEI
jgi:hypothetical protein